MSAGQARAIVCGVRVVQRHASASEGPAEEKLWGHYQFAEVPRQGELLSLLYEDEYQWVAVLRVEHHTVTMRPPTDVLFRRDEPKINVVAEWRGIV